MEYQVLSNLQHNGQAYNPGDSIVLGEEHAKPLLEAGVISTGEAERDAELGHPGVTDAQVRQSEIDAADAGLNGPVEEAGTDGRSQDSESGDVETPAEEATGEQAPLDGGEAGLDELPAAEDPLSDPTLAEDQLGEPSVPQDDVQIS